MDEWFNTVQAQINLARNPPDTAKILHCDIFWFFMKDEDFVSRTINEGSVDLEKFPASKVHQLAKKLESSKAMARHIRHVACMSYKLPNSISCATSTQTFLQERKRRKKGSNQSNLIPRMQNMHL